MPQPSVCTHWNSELDETACSNVIMGDVSEGLLRMIAPGGVDEDFLKGTDGEDILRDAVLYTNDDKAILRQYEGSMMPRYNYSMFAQEEGITVHHHLFEIWHTIQQMQKNHFSIPSDILHKVHTKDLMKQERHDLVKAVDCNDIELESEHEQVWEMESCIADARRLYHRDILTQLGLTDKDSNDADSLPDAIAIPALLNLLMGGKT